MPCDTLRVNIQDAAGDRVLAGDLLKREETSWQLWMQKRNYETHGGAHEYQTLSHEDDERISAQEADAHVHHVIGEVRRNSRRKFAKGPRMRWGETADSCRIYGSLEGNKVQGDFHITARGHGYREMAPHLDHSGMFMLYILVPETGCREGIGFTNVDYSVQFLAYDYRALLRSSLPESA